MKLNDLKIGIVALGWLGEDLAIELCESVAEVWGTTRQLDKQQRIKKNSEIDCVIWRNEDGISQELQDKLKQTDLLILNLPPSVFLHVSYAKGLEQFLLLVNDMTKVIFTSSTSVYPPHLENALESYLFEAHETNKIREAELLLESTLGSRLTILRLAGLIGEDRHPVYHLAKKEFNEHPDKSVNLIDKQDVIKVIKQVIQQNYFGEILNVCNPNHPSRKEYYTNKAKTLNLPELKFVQSVLNETDKVVNCQKLLEELSYKNFKKL